MPPLYLRSSDFRSEPFGREAGHELWPLADDRGIGGTFVNLLSFV